MKDYMSPEEFQAQTDRINQRILESLGKQRSVDPDNLPIDPDTHPQR